MRARPPAHRHYRTSLAAVLAGLVCAGFSASPAMAASAQDPVVFGAYTQPQRGQTLQQAVTALEATAGRQLGAVRVYDIWDQPFPETYDLWLRDSRHRIHLSVKPIRRNGERITWRAIADAQPGTPLYDEIVSWARRVRGYGSPMWFTFHHEPEAASSDPHGTATDFIDAWRKVISLFRAQGVTNASYVWTMTDYAFWRTDRRAAAYWYPGDQYVDGIGADAYNWFTCRTGINNRWKSLQEIIEPLRQFGRAHPGKELLLPEWGSAEDPARPGRKAQWFRDAQALFTGEKWAQFSVVLYFNNVDARYPNCRWWIDSSSSSRRAWVTMGANPAYAG